ncbi:hypothetical protein Natpe_2906 [Natrinema pellirubrum DSM 15624]|uniref:Uncharacterized protein n=2 Tax=Natrinema pellirubrum (strain DSM 15624 / CIP 106293 / JCM 10476 / NCIMB 786 / 157) TaxID=797303 RepID=L0JPC7_NATP1|nr:hypothetical protein Natpe_2906 [Natrinema pellirubrum DSM 15624]
MAQISTAANMTAAEQRDLAAVLGVDDPSDGAVTWAGLAGQIEPRSDSSFASRGEAIRADLDGRLERDRLERERANIADAIGRVPAVRDGGVPDGMDGPYTALAAPGWRLYDHLLEAGFFESLDENLPRFTAGHIETTVRELVLAEPLSSALDGVGFDEAEKTALLTDVANNSERLARWVPSNQIPDGVEFETATVPPLHQRAMGGALLWIRGLDRHLSQYGVLLTDEILDDAVRYTKAMLGGLFVTATAACDLVGDRRLTDEQLTAAFTAGSAVQIVAQEELCHSVFYITDEMRAPSELR